MKSRLQAPLVASILCAGLSAIPASAQTGDLTTASNTTVASSSPAPVASPFSSQRESEYAALARDVALGLTSPFRNQQHSHERERGIG